jgi:peptide/nickel transport system ATP-binding protein
MLSGGTSEGKITFDGESILDMDESEFDAKYRWKKISMIFQGAMNALDPVFTINEQFLEILKQHGFKGDFKKTILDAIHSVRLDETILKKYPHELSGGMKQRVIIAMALLLKPKFVIADEPTTALDVLTQAQIVNLLKSLKKEGMSFMLITHDLAVLSEIADKIGIMYGGEMVEFGSSEQIYKNPKHPYTQGLLESIPRLNGTPPKYIKGIPPSLLDAPTECRFIERCPLAIEKCKTLPPKFKTESGYVRCWLYDK